MNVKTLHKVSYGLYVVSSMHDQKINGQIANSLFQVSAEPPTLAVSINKQNLTHDYIENSKSFSVSSPTNFLPSFSFFSILRFKARIR